MLAENAETLVDFSSVLKGVGMTGFFGRFPKFSRNPKLKKLAKLKDFFINSRQSFFPEFKFRGPCGFPNIVIWGRSGFRAFLRFQGAFIGISAWTWESIFFD